MKPAPDFDSENRKKTGEKLLPFSRLCIIKVTVPQFEVLNDLQTGNFWKF
jgi:hypothetical protein